MAERAYLEARKRNPARFGTLFCSRLLSGKCTICSRGRSKSLPGASSPCCRRRVPRWCVVRYPRTMPCARARWSVGACAWPRVYVGVRLDVAPPSLSYYSSRRPRTRPSAPDVAEAVSLRVDGVAPNGARFARDRDTHGSWYVADVLFGDAKVAGSGSDRADAER